MNVQEQYEFVHELGGQFSHERVPSRRGPGPRIQGDECSLSLEELDWEIARLARAGGVLRLRVGEALEMLCRAKGHHELGFSSSGAYIKERCGRGPRWGQEARALARRLSALPGLRRAVLGGELSWSMAQVLAAHATADTEEGLLEEAAAATVRSMRERLREREAAAEDDGAPRDGAGGSERTGAREAEGQDDDEEEPQRVVTVTASPEEVWMWEATHKLVEHVAGSRLSFDERVEAILAETWTALQVGLRRDDDGQPPADSERTQRRRERMAAARRAAEARAETRLPVGEPVSVDLLAWSAPHAPHRIDTLALDRSVCRSSRAATGGAFTGRATGAENALTWGISDEDYLDLLRTLRREGLPPHVDALYAERLERAEASAERDAAGPFIRERPETERMSQPGVAEWDPVDRFGAQSPGTERGRQPPEAKQPRPSGEAERPRPHGEPEPQRASNGNCRVGSGDEKVTWRPEGLDRAIRRLVRELQAREAELGRLLLRLYRVQGWRRLGYATEAQYARERVALSLSGLKARIQLARRFESLPGVAQAAAAGHIGYESARLVARVALATTEAAWVNRAEQRTVKHLREEVEAVALVARCEGPDVLADGPPDPDLLEEVFEIERVIRSGGAIGTARIRVTRPREEVEGAGDGQTSARARGVGGDRGSQDKRGGGGADGQMSAHPRGAGDEAIPQGADGQMSAHRRGVAVVAGENAESAIVDGAPIPAVEATRITLRFTLRQDVAELWDALRALWRRHRGRLEMPSFVRTLCWSVWQAWGPSLGPTGVAYEEIYDRDRWTCTSPVCERRDLTPHHLKFRSQGGTDAEANLSGVCSWCHLEGIHTGRLRAQPPAPSIEWRIGRPTLLRVVGRNLIRPSSDG